MSIRIGFRQVMYVYSLEDAYNPTSLKVSIPDVFVDKNPSVITATRLNKGNTSIYKNKTPPALTSTYVTKNYIDLPVIDNFMGISNVIGASMSVDGSSLVIDSAKSDNYAISVGIGDIKKGDRLIALFMNETPQGVIIGRCQNGK